jgi:porin
MVDAPPRMKQDAPLMQLRAAVLLFVAFAGTALSQPADNFPWLRWDHATGDWNRSRPLLEDRGVEFISTYTGQVWGNLAGGQQTGAAYLQVLQFGLNADLEKAVGWRGGSFRTTWLWNTGEQPSVSLVGSNFAISGIEYPASLRALDLWLQQKLVDDALTLRAGLFNADAEFTVSDYAALFLNAGFGWPVLFSATGSNNPPAYPFAAPGLFAALEPGGGWKLQAAVMQANTYSAEENPNNFYWRFDRLDGLLFLQEIHYSWPKATLPGKAKLGVMFDTGSHDRIDGGGEVWGDAFFYAIVDQMLYREAADGVQGLGWFARAGFAPPDRNVVGTYFDTGFTYTGPLPGRDNDAAGLGFGWSQLTPDAARNVGGGNAGLEMVFEATYQAQITPWLALQPDLQFILQPGASTALGNALVIGLSASVDF